MALLIAWHNVRAGHVVRLVQSESPLVKSCHHLLLLSVVTSCHVGDQEPVIRIKAMVDHAGRGVMVIVAGPLKL